MNCPIKTKTISFLDTRAKINFVSESIRRLNASLFRGQQANSIHQALFSYQYVLS